MFRWLVDRIDDVRIAFAYIGYERECRERWIAEAEKEFSALEVMGEISRRMAGPKRHLADALDKPSSKLHLRTEDVRHVIADAETKLAILERDYQGELDAAYRKLDAAQADLEDCRLRLAAAHQDRESATRQLDSWYSKAEGRWLGDAGRELPKHSFFGQDLSDRDRFKGRRDRAGWAIGRLKSERSSIVRRISDARTVV